GMAGDPSAVNELLVQLQSFDQPAAGAWRSWLVDAANRWLPAHRQLRKPVTIPANILVIGATNLAAELDPALLRPGRFDRSIYFDLPSRSERPGIIDHYLARKAHQTELDAPATGRTRPAWTLGRRPLA